MAERRSYRSSVPPEERAPEPQQPRYEPKTHENRPNEEAPKSKFVNITGLFPARSGKADTVFLKQEHCDILQSLRPGDVLGVSMNQKTNKLSLWAIPQEEE